MQISNENEFWTLKESINHVYGISIKQDVLDSKTGKYCPVIAKYSFRSIDDQQNLNITVADNQTTEDICVPASYFFEGDFRYVTTSHTEAQKELTRMVDEVWMNDHQYYYPSIFYLRTLNLTSSYEDDPAIHKIIDIEVGHLLSIADYLGILDKILPANKELEVEFANNQQLQPTLKVITEAGDFKRATTAKAGIWFYNGQTKDISLLLEKLSKTAKGFVKF